MATYTTAAGKRATYKEASSSNNTYVINDDTKGATIAGAVNGDIIAIEGFATDFTASVSGRVITLKSTVDTGIVIKVQLANVTGATASFRFLDGDLTATKGAKITLGTQTLTSKAAAISESNTLGSNDSSATFDESSGSSTTGTTFTLTTDLDEKIGTSGNDTFAAGFTTAATFNSGDTVDGGAGTDTLSITVGAASTYALSNVSNVEAVKGNFTAAGTLSLLGSTGVTSVESNASTAAAIFTNISSTSVGLKETGTSTASTFTFTDAAVDGTADSATLTLSGVSKATTVATTIAGVETLNIVSASDSTLGLLTATSATTVNVSGSGALTVVDDLANVTTFSASANTGGVDVDFDLAVTATGGSGNDTFASNSAADVVVSFTGGAGNDTFQFDAAGVLTTADTVAGGEGTGDKLSVVTSANLSGYTAPTTATISGIEVLEFKSALAASFTTANIQAGIATVELDAGTNAQTITLDAGTKAVKVGALNTGLLTVADTGSATTDVLNITNTEADGADVIGATGLTSTGFETLNVSTSPVTGTTTLTLGAVTVTPDAGGTGVLNISGTNKATATTITADKLDVSGLTAASSGSTFTMTGSSGIETIIGSAGNDTLVGDADGVTITAGAGRDNVTGGAGNDTVLGGDGNDTISAGAGNDSISGDAGNDSITAGAGNDIINGGAGNDTLVLAENLATGDVIDGGADTDTLSVSDASLDVIEDFSITAATALNAAISNVERVTISTILNRGTFDAGRLDGIQNITLAAGINGNEALTGLASGAEITIESISNAITDQLTLTQSTDGSADSFTVNLTNDANTDFSEVTLVDVETLNIVTAQDTDAAALVTATFGVNASGDNNTVALTTLNISGTENLDMEEESINVLTVNATGLTSSLGGTAAALKFLGGNAAQTFNLGAGADSVNAGGGADTVNAGAGADTIIGGSGNDVILGEAGNDSITGGSENDTLTGGEGNDSLSGGTGNDSIVLTETTSVADQVQFSTAVGGTSDSGRVTVTGNDNDTGADTITGFTFGTDTILVTSTAVADFVHTDDVFIGTAVGDLNDGTAGSFLTNVGLIDLGGTGVIGTDDVAINFTTPSATLTTARLKAALAYNLTGTAAANTITSGSLADTITGGGGADVIDGGAGNDIYVTAATDSAVVTGTAITPALAGIDAVTVTVGDTFDFTAITATLGSATAQAVTYNDASPTGTEFAAALEGAVTIAANQAYLFTVTGTATAYNGTYLVVADDGTIDGGDIIIKLVGATTISVVAGDVVIAS